MSRDTVREQLAVIAGYYNGEGNCLLQCRSHWLKRTMCYTEYVTPKLSISNTYLPELEHAQSIIGGNVYTFKRNYNKTQIKRHKQLYELRMSGFENVQATIAALWIWLSQEKKDQSADVLDRYLNWFHDERIEIMSLKKRNNLVYFAMPILRVKKDG